jgi:hypothetical protein
MSAVFCNGLGGVPLLACAAGAVRLLVSGGTSPDWYSFLPPLWAPGDVSRKKRSRLVGVAARDLARAGKAHEGLASRGLLASLTSPGGCSLRLGGKDLRRQGPFLGSRAAAWLEQFEFHRLASG